MTKYKISTSDMVTVVKVVATEDDDGRQTVEAQKAGSLNTGYAGGTSRIVDRQKCRYFGG